MGKRVIIYKIIAQMESTEGLTFAHTITLPEMDNLTRTGDFYHNTTNDRFSSRPRFRDGRERNFNKHAFNSSVISFFAKKPADPFANHIYCEWVQSHDAGERLTTLQTPLQQPLLRELTIKRKYSTTHQPPLERDEGSAGPPIWGTARRG